MEVSRKAHGFSKGHETLISFDYFANFLPTRPRWFCYNQKKGINAQIWTLKLDWYESLPSQATHTAWTEIYQEVMYVNEIVIQKADSAMTWRWLTVRVFTFVQ